MFAIPDLGAPRRPGQTPRELERALAAQFETSAAQFALITDAYLDARYSDAPLTAQDVERVTRA